jgi:hypothetical protein
LILIVVLDVLPAVTGKDLGDLITHCIPSFTNYINDCHATCISSRPWSKLFQFAEAIPLSVLGVSHDLVVQIQLSLPGGNPNSMEEDEEEDLPVIPRKRPHQSIQTVGQ